MKLYSKENKKVIIIALVFFAVSLAHCLYYVNATMTVSPYGYDEQNYIACAKRLIETGCFSFWGYGPDAYVAPVFPMFLALCMMIFGKGLSGIIALRFIQSVMIAVGVALSCRLAYKLSGSLTASIFTGAFLASNGSFSYYATFVLTEPICFFFTVLFLNRYVDFLQHPSEKTAYQAGLFYAFAILTRPPIAVLIPLFVITFFKKTNLKQKLMFAGGMLTLILPWFVRNLISLKKVVFFSTQTNAFFWGFCKDPVALGLKDPGTILGNLKLVWSFIKDDPAGMFRYMTIDKFRYIFLGYEELTVDRILLPSLDLMVRIIFVGLGFLGILFGLITKKYRGICIYVIVFIIATFLVIPQVRYGFPVYPMLGMFAGVVAEMLYKQAKTM